MKKIPNSAANYNQLGFSLVEMAIVLVILGFVIAALLLPLQAQRDQNFRVQTENTLAVAQKALLGYAQAKGRLPCPAPVGSASGLEDPLGGTACTVKAGYLPATTLGLQPTNSSGLLVDGWNNPIRYAVTQVTTTTVTPAGADFTTTNKPNNVGLTALLPDLRVCSDSSTCSASTYLINNAVAVIFSTGKNYPTAGVDETANLAATATTFYSRVPTAVGATGGEFDDIVVWISPFILYNAMLQAGQIH